MKTRFHLNAMPPRPQVSPEIQQLRDLRRSACAFLVCVCVIVLYIWILWQFAATPGCARNDEPVATEASP